MSYRNNFTRTESKVLNLLQDDNFLTDEELASSLNVSINTVRTHLKNMFKKSGVSGRNSKFQLIRKQSER